MKEKSYEEMIRERRALLKSSDLWRDEWESHQRKGIPPPPLEKTHPKDCTLIDLIEPDETKLGNIPLSQAINHRESRRKYTSEALTLKELSFLLWSTQGIKTVDPNKVWTKRTVPSGGARHPFETYLIANRVEGLEPGTYRYLPVEHKLLLVNPNKPLREQLSEACWGQGFAAESAVVFVWAAYPYRSEWRYSEVAYKLIAVEAGHICQNLYLACEAIGAGTCAILAYNQRAIDRLVGIDGIEEFTVYLAPVGKI